MKNILSFKSAMVALMGLFSLSALGLSSCIVVDDGCHGGHGGHVFAPAPAHISHHNPRGFNPGPMHGGPHR